MDLVNVGFRIFLQNYIEFRPIVNYNGAYNLFHYYNTLRNLEVNYGRND